MAVRPDIVILVLDTQRADRLSCYGYPLETTPYLDELAVAATRYEHAIAPGQWTVPTHASIFTGEFSSRHKLLQTDSILTDELPTLAERLRDAGYYTAGFSHNPLIGAVKNGLDRGFRQFTNYQHKRSELLTFHLSESEITRGLASQLRRNTRSFLAELLGYSQETPIQHLAPLVSPIWSIVQNLTQSSKEAMAIDSLQAAARLLIERPGFERDQPAFVFINLMGTHVPYEPAKWAVQRFITEVLGGRSANSLLQRANAWQVNVRNWIDLALPADEVQSLLGACYDAEVATQDALVGDFFRQLKESGRLDSTFAAITADHGDHLGEKQRLNHAFGVYEQLVWVPLIIHDPVSAHPAGTSVGETVSTRRLFHTALAAANEADAQEASLALSSISTTPDSVLTQGVPLSWAVRRLQRDHPTLLANSGGDHISQAVYQGAYKLIQTGERFQLFDWQSDPAETIDLSARLPDELSDLQALLRPFVEKSELPIEASGQEEIDPHILEHLRNLGYLE